MFPRYPTYSGLGLYGFKRHRDRARRPSKSRRALGLSDEGYEGAEDVGDYQGDEVWHEDEGGAEGYGRAEGDADDESDGAWHGGGWHDDDYAEEEGRAEDEQSMSPTV